MLNIWVAAAWNSVVQMKRRPDILRPWYNLISMCQSPSLSIVFRLSNKHFYTFLVFPKLDVTRAVQPNIHDVLIATKFVHEEAMYLLHPLSFIFWYLICRIWPFYYRPICMNGADDIDMMETGAPLPLPPQHPQMHTIELCQDFLL